MEIPKPSMFSFIGYKAKQKTLGPKSNVLIIPDYGFIPFEIKMLSKYRLLNIDGNSKACPFLAPIMRLLYRVHLRTIYPVVFLAK